VTVPRVYAVVLPAYLAVLLAVDTQVPLHGQIALGVLTFAVLAAALWPLTRSCELRPSASCCSPRSER
jgi:hypothetical protein